MRSIPSRAIQLVLLATRLVGRAWAQSPSVPPAAPVPDGWRLTYEQHFDAPASLLEFAMTDPRAWRFAADAQGFTLELAQQSQYQPEVRSPVNIAVLRERIFGDFVLEVNLVQTGQEYGHRDMCLFFGMQDSTHFYYVHLATKADEHAHNVFLVNASPRVKIARETTDGVNWGLAVWHRVRLERRLGDGTIRVFFDEMSKPLMVAEDRTFGAGWIGFGSFDDTGKVDDIRIWTPERPVMKVVPFFSRPELK